MVLKFLRRCLANDAGFSLIEIIVGAGIMVTVTAIAAQGFQSMYHTVDKTDGAVNAQNALLAAFNKLDHEVRYANRVNNEGSTSTLWSVTYVLPTDDGNQSCIQLTLPKAGGSLMRRTWVRPTVYSAPTATYTTVATDLAPAAYAQTGDTTTTPFNVVGMSPSTGKNFDTLNLRVAGNVGLGMHNTKRYYDITFTALNTVSSATTLKCLS